MIDDEDAKLVSEDQGEHNLPPVPQKRRRFQFSPKCGAIFLAALLFFILMYLSTRSRSDSTKPADFLNSTSLIDSHLPPVSAVSSSIANQLKSVTCIPAVCKIATRIRRSNAYTLLASYPGSGNTWTRAIVEEGTRVWTGSVYLDMALYHDGFRGETIDPYRDEVFCPLSAIKTHYPYFRNPHLSAKNTGAVIVLRSPFDAILAEFSRKYGTGASHRSQVSNATLLRHFPDEFREKMFKWKGFVDFWVRDRHMNGTINRDRGVLSLEFEHNMVDHKIPVLVLFYEDFVRNFQETSSRLFAFFKSHMKDAMLPSVMDAVVCASITSQNKEKRKHAESAYNVYQDPLNRIGLGRMVEQACKLWAPYWFEEVWGKCLDPQPQLSRLPLSAQVSLDHLKGEYCAQKKGQEEEEESDLESQQELIKGDEYAEEADMENVEGENDEEEEEEEEEDGYKDVDLNGEEEVEGEQEDYEEEGGSI